MFRFTGIISLLLLAGIILIQSSCIHQNNTSNQEMEQSSLAEDPLVSINDLLLTDSLNPELYNRKASLELDRNLLNEALGSIRKAIGLNPENPEYYITLSDIYLAQGKIRNCKESLEKALEIAPGNNEAILKLAELSLILKDYEKVQKLTNRAIGNDPDNPLAYFIKGYAFLETGDTNSAIGSMIKSIEQDRDYYAAYMQIGLLYSLKNDRIAIDYFNNALRIDPESKEALYAMAMFYQESGDYHAALDYYQKILQIDPENKFAIYNSGYIELVYNKNFSAARDHFSQVIEIDPEYADAYYNMGYCFELENNLEEARKYYNYTLQVYSNHLKAIDGLNRLDRMIRQ